MSIPSAPYLLGLKSPYRKTGITSWDQLAIRNPRIMYHHIQKYYSKNSNRPNRLEKHLRWLIEQGKHLRVLQRCNYCHRGAKYFYLKGSDEINLFLVAGYTCDQPDCRSVIGYQDGIYPTPFRFQLETFLDPMFRSRTMRKELTNFFLKSAGIKSSSLTAQQAFEYFQLCGQAQLDREMEREKLAREIETNPPMEPSGQLKMIF